MQACSKIHDTNIFLISFYSELTILSELSLVWQLKLDFDKEARTIHTLLLAHNVYKRDSKLVWYKKQ